MVRIAAKCITILVCVSLVTPSSRAAIVIQGFNANQHDRFNNSPQFIGNPFNWAGVGRSNTGTWGTLISPSYVVSATHGPSGGTMRFYQTNNPAGPFVDRNVVSGVQIAGSDLFLSRLDSPATGITPFSIVSFPSDSDFIGQTIFTVGLSAGAASPQTDQRFGRNTIDRIIPNFSDPNLGSSQGNVFLFDYDNPGGVGADESYLQSGDSAGPSFIVGNGQPGLVGIHWFIYDGNDFGGAQLGSGDTFVSSYINQLNAAMIGESVTVLSLQSVPEPSSLLVTLVGLSGCAVVARFRRSRRRFHSPTVQR